jgi:hypothetical protein
LQCPGWVGNGVADWQPFPVDEVTDMSSGPLLDAELPSEPGSGDADDPTRTLGPERLAAVSIRLVALHHGFPLTAAASPPRIAARLMDAFAAYTAQPTSTFGRFFDMLDAIGGRRRL